MINLTGYKIRPSKHVIKTWMRKWNYTLDEMKNAIENAYRTEKVGKYKYETYIRTKGGSRKLIFIKDDEYKDILIITGAEGK